MEAFADLVLRLAKRGCEGGSRLRRVDGATDSEEQLGRPGSAGLPSPSSLIFSFGHDCVHSPLNISDRVEHDPAGGSIFGMPSTSVFSTCLGGI